jgi:hypothetical protein
MAVTFFCALGQSAPSIASVSAQPASIITGSATNIVVTATVADPTVLAADVNLLRVSASGASAVILRQRHDDGKNGDAVGGDNVFSTQISLNEPNPGQVFLRLSAPFQGTLQRVLSAIMAVTETAGPPLPPDPSTVAPHLTQFEATPFGHATSFPYNGPKPIQTGVDKSQMIVGPRFLAELCLEC